MRKTYHLRNHRNQSAYVELEAESFYLSRGLVCPLSVLLSTRRVHIYIYLPVYLPICIWQDSLFGPFIFALWFIFIFPLGRL